MPKRRVTGALASNAGDEFHELWALGKCLELLIPSSDLKAVQVEGISTQTDGESSGPQWDGVDCTLYYEGTTVEEASRVTVTQLKYSVSSTPKNWTVGEFCHSSAKTTDNSVARRLALAFNAIRKIRSEQDIQSFLRLIFISNRPISPKLEQLLIRIRRGNLDGKEAAKLEAATGLSRIDLPSFATCLTLEGCASPRWKLEAHAIRAVSSVTDDIARTHLDRLRTEVVKLMLPESPRVAAVRDTVLAWFGVADWQALFPCSAEIERPPSLVSRDSAATLARAVEDSQIVCLHGGGGCGKTTLIGDLGKRLPGSSELILYDCYGAGRYNDPSTPRHRPAEAFTQLSNEIAQRLGFPTFVPVGAQVNYARAFRKRANEAAISLRDFDDSALLVIVVDAADNAFAAAGRRKPNDQCFVDDIIQVTELEPNIRLIISVRTSSLPTLNIPRHAKKVLCSDFKLSETAEFVSCRWPDAPSDWIEQFHYLARGNPRVMATAFAVTDHPKEAINFLRPDGKSLEDIYDALLDQASKKAGIGAKIEEICAALSILPTPTPVEYISEVCGQSPQQIKEACNDLAPSLRLIDERVEFSNEDFEHFVRNVGHESAGAVRTKAAACLKANRFRDAYAARNLFDVLALAGREQELFALLDEQDGLVAVSDPILRSQIQLQRMRLLVAYSADIGDTQQAIQTIIVGAEAAKAGNELESLLATHPALSVCFANENSIRDLLRNADFQYAHGPLLMHLAATEALTKGHMPVSRELRRSALAWIRRRYHLDDNDRHKWSLGEDAIAAWADAVYVDQGPAKAIEFLRGWSPPLIAFGAGRILIDRVVRREGPDSIRKWYSVAPRTFQFVISNGLIRAGCCPDRSDLESQVAAITRLKIGETEFRSGWHRQGNEECLVDDALFFCEAALNAGVSSGTVKDAVESIWPRDRQVSEQIYSSSSFAIAMSLRAYSMLARIDELPYGVDEVFGLAKEDEESNANSEVSDRVKDLRKAAGHIVGLYAPPQASTETDRPDTASTSPGTNRQSLKFVGESYELDNRRYGFYIRPIAARRVADLFALQHLDVTDALATVHRIFGSRPLHPNRCAEVLTLISCNRQAHESVLLECVKMFSRASTAREAASEKVEAIVQLAKVALPISREDAEVMFLEAAATSKEMDREAFDQIALLAMASENMQATAPQNPEAAADLALFIEEAAIRLAGVDEFPWDLAFQGLMNLDPAVCVCALSRWTDAGVCDFETSLRLVLSAGLEAQFLRPEHVVSSLHLLRRQQKSLIETVVRKAQVDGDSNGTSLHDELAGIVVDNCVTAGEIKEFALSVPLSKEQSSTGSNLARLQRLTQFVEESAKPLENEADHSSETYSTPSANEDIGSLGIEDVDVTSADAIESVVLMARERKIFDVEGIYRSLRHRAPVGQRVKHLGALSELIRRNEYIAPIVDSILSACVEWKDFPAILAWKKENFPKLIRDVTPKLLGYSWYHESSLSKLLSVVDVSRSDLLTNLLTGTRIGANNIGPTGLYLIAAHLALLANPTDRMEVLSWCARRWSDGIGKFDETKIPTRIDVSLLPNRADDSFYSLVYRLLGDIDRRVRWRAAHALRSLVRLGHSASIGYLIDLTDRRSCFEYADPNAPFHGMTAILWLAIALDRIAIEAPDVIRENLAKLLDIATDETLPHAVVRHYVTRAVRTVSKDQETRKAIAKINRPALLKRCSNHYSRRERSLGHEDPRAKQRFHFNAMDTLPYWYAHALSVFVDVTAIEFLDQAEKWIIDAWGANGEEYRWDQEPRKGRYDERSFSLWGHSHGDYPTMERYSRYLEWHAMCCTVGAMVGTRTCGIDDEGMSAFDDWLSIWDLTHPPYWLSDLRSDKPTSLEYWKPLSTRSDGWLTEVSDEEFLREIRPPADREWIILYSDRTMREYRYGTQQHREGVRVTAAFVSEETAVSLVRALQVIDEPYDYGLPLGPSKNLEIDAGRFQLLPCVNDAGNEMRFDKADPACRDVRGLFVKPGPRFKELHTLEKMISNSTQWVDTRSQTAIFHLSMWSDTPSGYTDSEQTLDRQYSDGWRLMVDFEALKTDLNALNMSLIFSVQIDREKGNRYGRASAEEAEERVYDKLFVLRRDGQLEDAHGPIPSW